ncbi:MAG: DNA topoisomerase IB [Candidatus Nanopelagicales bacterium]
MRLRRSDPSAPGIARRRSGKGFRYLDQNGNPVDAGTRERIEALVLPPAWEDVWICPWPHGHIQATGVDAAGRRQYRYHDEWRRQRDARKHDHVLELASRLPSARRRAAAALRRPLPDRERVLAGCFRMLDVGSLRIGSETYADTNETFGLATLRRDHVRVDGGRLALEFLGKSGKQIVTSLSDRPLSRLVGELLVREDDNPDLFAWYDGEAWHDVRSADVNAYLRTLLGSDVTAKDFRTWNATVLMAQRLALAGWDERVTRRRRIVAGCYRDVSEYLGNTPAVAKSSYVDPRIVDLYDDGVVLPTEVLPARDTHLPVHAKVERAVGRLLLPDRPARRRAA